MSDKKSRYWAFIVYPNLENIEEIYEEISATHMACILSPLHDKDVYNKDDEKHKKGEIKKPHFHGIWQFSGPARLAQALNVNQCFGDKSPQFVEPVADLIGYTRYFAHLDDPQKAAYNVNDIIAFNGGQINLERPKSAEENRRIMYDVLAWINQRGILEYKDVVDYAFHHEPDWVPIVTSKTIFFAHYMSSARAKKGVKNDQEKH